MKTPTALLLIPCVLLTSCATIVSKSNYPVEITSNPAGAKFTLKENKQNTILHQGVTPTTVTLPASYGYFKPASYTLEFTKKGSTPQTIQVNSAIDGWYFGNILFGGLIGMVIVDPLTGAMWKLDSTVNADLTPLATLKNGNGRSLQVVDRTSVPADMEKHLVALR